VKAVLHLLVVVLAASSAFAQNMNNVGVSQGELNRSVDTLLGSIQDLSKAEAKRSSIDGVSTDAVDKNLVCAALSSVVSDAQAIRILVDLQREKATEVKRTMAATIEQNTRIANTFCVDDSKIDPKFKVTTYWQLNNWVSQAGSLALELKSK